VGILFFSGCSKFLQDAESRRFAVVIIQIASSHVSLCTFPTSPLCLAEARRFHIPKFRSSRYLNVTVGLVASQMIVSELQYIFIFLRSLSRYSGNSNFYASIVPTILVSPIFLSLNCDIAIGGYMHPRITDPEHVTVFSDTVSSIEIRLIVEVRHYARRSNMADILPTQRCAPLSNKSSSS